MDAAVELFIAKMETIAFRLASKARPGHVEYVSKDAAAAIINREVKDVRAAVGSA